MYKLSTSVYLELVEKLIVDTKQGKLSWGNPGHHTDSPPIFDSYVFEQDPEIAILSDSAYTSFNEGYIYFLHICTKKNIQEENEINLYHGIYTVTDKEKLLDAAESYKICVQTHFDLYPIDIGCDINNASEADKERIESELYTLHQLIIRNNYTVSDFIYSYLYSN